MDVVIDATLDRVSDRQVITPLYGQFYQAILACSGYEKDALPLADLLRQYHSLEGRWLIVSPIYWQATHNDAMIVASGHDLELSEQESRAWLAAFSEHVASEGMKTYYHDTDTWLLQCDDKPSIISKAVTSLQSQSMMPELRLLDKTLFWQRLITENQMHFSMHPLNKDRGERCPINGIWIWGSGALEKPSQRHIVCYDPSLVSLAKRLSTNVSGYAPSNAYTKNDLLLCQSLNEEQLMLLEAHLKHETVRWYWNNIAYQTQPKTWRSWLKGLFNRTSIHAN